MKPLEHINSYYAASVNSKTNYPPLEGNRKTDVCVIGAGFTGVSASLSLAERGYDAVQAIRTHGDTGTTDANSSIVIKELTKELNREKSLIIDHDGYTEFYIIKGGTELDTSADELEVDADASKRVITSAFKKHSKSKTLNRVILSRFVELIA